MGFLHEIILTVITYILVRETAFDYDINFPTFNLNRDVCNFTMLNSKMSSNVLQVMLDTNNFTNKYI